MVLKICGEPLKDFHLIKFFTIVNKLANTTDILAIGNDQVILFNIKTMKLIWQLNIHEVETIEIVRLSCISFKPMNCEVDAFHQDMA